MMFGPGKGHNAVRFLDFFQESQEHQLTYYHYNKAEHFELETYAEQIKFVASYNFLTLIKEIRNNQDLLWIHNWTPWPILILIHLFTPKKTVKNFNVWSEQIPRMLATKTLKAQFFNYFLRKCHTVQCTWFSTLNILKEQGFTNTVMLRWGMVEEKFADLNEHQHSEFVNGFTSCIPQDRFKFFFPKSVSHGNRHDLVVEACKKLKEAGIENYIVYFWLGNFNREELLNDLKKNITDYGLEDNIKIVHHDFVSHEDIQVVWRKMDCGLQILEMDQLSTSFQEPLLYEKEIIASNIESYQLFQNEFGVKLDLISNNTDSLTSSMKSLIQGNVTQKEELDKRKNVILDHYRFSKNMPNMLNYFFELKKDL